MIVGMEKLNDKLDKLSNLQIEKAMKEAVLLVQRDAKMLAPVEGGELRDSIFTDVSTDGKITKGTCFTNKQYAMYVEFGTGPKGQAEHSGISPEINPVYSQSPWWIHESQIDKGLAEKYHWFHLDTENGRFYLCYGQAAQPFMYPALKDNKEHIRKIFANQVKRAIEGGST